MISVSYFQRPGLSAEPILLRPAAVAAPSVCLQPCAHQSPHHGYDAGQLALYQANARHAVPADLAAVPAPRIGYTGWLSSERLDVDLLLCLARKRPDYHLVLVGPEDDHFRQSPLHSLPNVHFLGSKALELLPAYVQHFDVCINPLVVGAVTPGNSPLRIDAYLAMGRPVVAARTQIMEPFVDYIYLANNKYEWLAQLAQVLVAPDATRTARGAAFAQSPTWPAQVTARYAALQTAGAACADGFGVRPGMAPMLPPFIPLNASAS